jgi:hypothetical protein
MLFACYYIKIYTQPKCINLGIKKVKIENMYSLKEFQNTGVKKIHYNRAVY